ncbi:MAG: tyrosine-type recombinase/integrase [Ignavibacteriae bacterium]|nr:tyrosine-type recombinase/integrase [Ignavibacteriota bacterium]
MIKINKAINDFINHCIYEKNLSPKTIKSYKIDLSQLFNFLINNDYSVDISEITKHELREYLISISALRPKSVKRKIAVLKAMFNYLEFEDAIVINPFRKMRIKIREPKVLPKAMNKTEVYSIFKTAYKQISSECSQTAYSYAEKLRNIVVIELLFATGARVSEIADLKKENVNIYSGLIKIKGKGNKERIINICNKETFKILQDYYKLFIKKIEGCGGYFLINRLGKKLSDQSVRTIVRNLALNSSFQKKITPHMFRHTFATLLLEKDVDIKYIQSMLGHSSILTTQIYTQVNNTKQKQILKLKHPRKELIMLES